MFLSELVLLIKLNSALSDLNFSHDKIAEYLLCSGNVSAQNTDWVHASFERTKTFIEKNRSHMNKLALLVDIVTFSDQILSLLECWNLKGGRSQLFISSSILQLSFFISFDFFRIYQFDEGYQVRTNEEFLLCFHSQQQDIVVAFRVLWDF
jgi:hypothetical protein